MKGFFLSWRIIPWLMLYPAICLLMCLLQESFLFPGARASDGLYYRYAANEQQVTHEGVTLQGWHRINPLGQKGQVLLYFGGNAEDVITALPMLESLGAEHIYTFNYRGYGKSQGSPSQASLFNDALILFDRIATEQPANSQFIILGRSLGSVVAGHVTTERHTQGLILLTPLKSAMASGQRTYPFLPVSFLLRHPLDLHAMAPHFHAPTLVLIAEDDRVIHPEHSLATYTAINAPKQLIRLTGVGHNNVFDNPGTLEAMQVFLAGRE